MHARVPLHMYKGKQTYTHIHISCHMINTHMQMDTFINIYTRTSNSPHSSTESQRARPPRTRRIAESKTGTLKETEKTRGIDRK